MVYSFMRRSLGTYVFLTVGGLCASVSSLTYGQTATSTSTSTMTSTVSSSSTATSTSTGTEPACLNPKTIPPQPAPIPDFRVNRNFTGRTLVGGSVTTSNSGSFDVRQGEQVFNLITPAIPARIKGGPIPECPQPFYTASFRDLIAPQDHLILVLVHGSPDSFQNATFNFFLGGMSLGAQITPQASCPTGLPSGVTCDPIPPGRLGGYFTMKIPQGSSNSQSFTMTTSRPGDISMVAKFLVTGTASSQVFTRTSNTIYWPGLEFVSTSAPPLANSCSGVNVVRTIDGNGNPVDVPGGGGFILRTPLSASPMNIFMDAACSYPTSFLAIANPPSIGPGSGGPGRPPATTSAGTVSFYFRSAIAGSFPINVINQVNSDGAQMQSVSRVVSVLTLPPVSMTFSGPSSVNQGECSAPFKVILKDKYGNETPVIGSKSLNFGMTSTTTAYSDARCNNPISNLSFSNGMTQTEFYVRDNKPETLRIGILDSAPAGSAIQTAYATLRVLDMASVASASSPAVADQMARKLYERLAGTPPPPGSAVLTQMSSLILAGKIMEAAHLATEQDSYYFITLVNFTTKLSDRFGSPLAGLNDFVTTWVGTIRDNRDGREILTGNKIYVGSALRTPTDQVCANSSVYRTNDHFNQLAMNLPALRSELVPVPQCTYNSNNANPAANFGSDNPVVQPDTAGLLTTRTWGANHLVAGTNRRAIEQAFHVFLCKSLTELADTSTGDWHIRRDVDRVPAGDAKVYNASCRGCHGGMDALGGAFAFFDAYPNPMNGGDFRVFYVKDGGYGEGGVMPKMNINSGVFPPGYKTADDSWQNLWNDGKNEALEWSGEVSSKGNGVHAFGEMLANSGAFASCMATRVFTHVCKRPPMEGEEGTIKVLKDDFIASGYNFRRLFEKSAAQSKCLGNE